MRTNLALAFYNHARAHPERPALFVNDREFSYGEVAEIAARIAAWLQLAAQPAKLVGILASRSWPAYAGVLGACWSGAAYVPLNPEWPEQRLLDILTRTELDALIVDDHDLKVLSSEILRAAPKRILAPARQAAQQLGAAECIRSVESWNALANAPLAEPSEMTADDLAYIIFTSGTTGSPKGVMVTTGSVWSFLKAMNERYDFGPKDRISQRHDLSFDFSVLDLFVTWFSGASLHVIPATQLMGPSRFIREHQLTVWFSVPSVIAFMSEMKMLTAGAFPSLRYSAFCGEPLPTASVRKWQEACPNSVIDNIYGPTEATVACLGYNCAAELLATEERGTVAIGRPFPGMRAAVLDPNLNFLPAGEKGELALCGKQLATEYFNDPQRTAARFVSLRGETWYLTGDLAYQDTNGAFHHLGRTDNQVKVLGNRVELEDIEAHLRQSSGTTSVAAVPWPVVNGSAGGIVAFVSGSKLTGTEIRARMQLHVPRYMVPSAVRVLDRLPLNANGKTDRKSLTEMLLQESE